jgi:hypothetical protein
MSKLLICFCLMMDEQRAALPSVPAKAKCRRARNLCVYQKTSPPARITNATTEEQDQGDNNQY